MTDSYQYRALIQCDESLGRVRGHPHTVTNQPSLHTLHLLLVWCSQVHSAFLENIWADYSISFFFSEHEDIFSWGVNRFWGSTLFSAGSADQRIFHHRYFALCSRKDCLTGDQKVKCIRLFYCHRQFFRFQSKEGVWSVGEGLMIWRSGILRKSRI